MMWRDGEGPQKRKRIRKSIWGKSEKVPRKGDSEGTLIVVTIARGDREVRGMEKAKAAISRRLSVRKRV